MILKFAAISFASVFLLGCNTTHRTELKKYENLGVKNMDCIFCDIIAGKSPASIVYEDDFVLGIMSLDQPNPYKAMILPKDHVENIYDLTADQASKIFQAAVIVANGIKKASDCPGLNLVQANGAVGQQDVFHFHLHLLPRFENDSVTINWPFARPDRHELDQMAKEIRSCIIEK